MGGERDSTEVGFTRLETTVFAWPVYVLAAPFLLPLVSWIPLFWLERVLHLPGLFPAAMIAGMVLSLALLGLGRMRVIVGRDGVLLRRGRRVSFLPFWALEAACLVNDLALRLTLRAGGSAEIPLTFELADRRFPATRLPGGPASGNPGQTSPIAYALLRQIRAGIERASASHAEDARRTEALLALTHGHRGATYRAAEAPPDEDLWRIVADAAALPGARAAAARALRRAPIEDYGPRLARIAEETARPALGRFLRIAADPGGADDKLAEVLAEVLAEEEQEIEALEAPVPSAPWRAGPR